MRTVTVLWALLVAGCAGEVGGGDEGAVGAIEQQLGTAPGGFDEQFSSESLDPAWTVVAARGNTFSLTANPGHLRYSVTPMTHGDGFLNGYQTTYGEHSCCTHDPGLELHRTFEGDRWLLDSKVTYHLPLSNGRQLFERVYFGDGGPGTFFVVVNGAADLYCYRRRSWSSRTCNPSSGVSVALVEKTGPGLSDRTYHAQAYLQLDTAADNTHWLRLERDGGVLVATWSHDGTTWTEAFRHDLGSRLDGLQQRVVLTGLSWYTPAGSYADYDYITLTPTEPPNQAPIAECQPADVCADALACTAPASIDAGSFDPDGDPITLLQSPAGPYAIGESNVLLDVSDGSLAASCTATVSVRDCTPPDIMCPSEIVAECTSPVGAVVTPQPATATDTCSGVNVTDPPPTDDYALGTTLIAYTATDLAGNQSSCSASIDVEDTTPPFFMAAEQANLWPANHQYRRFNLADCIAALGDTCDAGVGVTSARITSISSDEPDDQLGGGDGNTLGDILIADAMSASLRAERQGDGNGRVYTVSFAVPDASGNTLHGSCTVGVPHDRSGGPPVDDGVAAGYAVTLP